MKSYLFLYPELTVNPWFILSCEKNGFGRMVGPTDQSTDRLTGVGTGNVFKNTNCTAIATSLSAVFVQDTGVKLYN